MTLPFFSLVCNPCHLSPPNSVSGFFFLLFVLFVIFVQYFLNAYLVVGSGSGGGNLVSGDVVHVL